MLNLFFIPSFHYEGPLSIIYDINILNNEVTSITMRIMRLSQFLSLEKNGSLTLCEYKHYAFQRLVKKCYLHKNINQNIDFSNEVKNEMCVKRTVFTYSFYHLLL